MELSIVIPAYEESHKIARDVEAAAAFFAAGRLEGELIVVDDGSRDDTSGAARRAGEQFDAPLRVIRLDPTMAKAARSGREFWKAGASLYCLPTADTACRSSGR